MENKKEKNSDEYAFLYKIDIVRAKEIFGDHFTCNLARAPQMEDFQVAVIPWEDADGRFDNVEVCLFQAPACFMRAYLRKGGKRFLRISTRSGDVVDLWKNLDYPLVKHIMDGDIGVKTVE